MTSGSSGVIENELSGAIINKIMKDIEQRLDKRDDDLHIKIMGDVQLKIDASKGTSETDITSMKLQYQENIVKQNEILAQLDCFEKDKTDHAAEQFKAEIRMAAWEAKLHQMSRQTVGAKFVNTMDCTQSTNPRNEKQASNQTENNEDILKRLNDIEEHLRSLEARQSETIVEVHDVEKDMQDTREQVVEVEGEVQELEEEVQVINSKTSSREGRGSNILQAISNHYTYSKHRAMNYPRHYEFEMSTWDMMVFLGLGVMNRADSLLAIADYLLTVFVQIVFILIVARSMTDDPLENADVDQLKLWRAFKGHSVDFYDTSTNSSLVARTCSGSLDSIRSGQQADLYDNVDSYLLHKLEGNGLNDWLMVEFLKDFDGSILCILCFFLWTMSCLKEFSLVCNFSAALLAKHSTSTDLAREGDQFRLAGISSRRFAALAIFGLFPRMFILTTLYAYGSLFLLRTQALSDLILNAVALAFILEIDDEIFEVLAPFSAKAILMNVDEVYVGRVSRDSFWYMILDVPALLYMLGLVTLVVVVYVTLLDEFVHHMQDAKNVICGGNRDFVTTTNLANGLVYYYPTQSLSETDVKRTQSWYYQKTGVDKAANYYEIVSNEEAFVLALQYIVKGDTIADLVTLRTKNSQEAADLYSCVDQIPSWPSTTVDAFSTYLGYFLAGSSLRTCSDMQPWCAGSNVSFAIRTVCPVSCLCAEPISSIYDLTGCPETCSTSRSTALTSYVVSTCNGSEIADSNASSNSTFYDFMVEFQTVNAAYMESMFSSLGYDDLNYTLADRAWQNGCDTVSDLNYVTPNPCDTSLSTRNNLQGFCPSTCSFAVGCPPGEPSGAPTPSDHSSPGPSPNTNSSNAPTPSGGTPSSAPTPSSPNPNATPSSPSPTLSNSSNISSLTPSNSSSLPVSPSNISSPTPSNSPNISSPTPSLGGGSGPGPSPGPSPGVR